MKPIQVNYCWTALKSGSLRMSVKVNHLLRGFQALGIKTVLSKKLGEEDKLRKKMVDGLTLLELVFEDNSSVKFWMDLAAKGKIKPFVLKEGELYFKIQYLSTHNDCSYIQPIAESVSAPVAYFNNLRMLRQEKLKKDYKYDVMGLFRKVSMWSRVACVRKVLEQKNWNSYVTVYDSKGLFMSNAGIRKLPYVEHLKVQAHSKICLSIADKACRCYRDTEVLGFGGCLLVFESGEYQDFPHDKPCWISIKKDWSDFVEKVNYYLEHDEEREQIAQNGLEYYEKYLSPVAAAKMVIDQCERIRG